MHRDWETSRYRKEKKGKGAGLQGLWESRSEAINAGTSVQNLRANRASDMNPTQPWQPLTFSQKPLGGCSGVIVSIFLPNSPWPLLSSICTSPLHLFISSLQLSAHKLLFFSSSPFSLSVVLIHSWSEQSHRFIGQTWLHCVRMWGWEREKEGECARALGRHKKAESGPEVNTKERTGASRPNFRSFCAFQDIWTFQAMDTSVQKDSLQI